VVGENIDCTGCGLCVASCSGQSIFLIEEKAEENIAYVSMPYEFLPLPERGDRGLALNRSGEVVCETEIIKLRSSKAMDKTNILTIKVPLDMAMKARFFKPLTEGGAKNA
jgi:ferredoxin